MSIEGLDCWDDYPMEHGCICGNDCEPPKFKDPTPEQIDSLRAALKGLDPFPYQSIQSAEIGLDYRVSGAYLISRPEQRPGYSFKPGPEYSQNREDYA